MAAGEPLVELETDKVDVEVAAPKNGVLAEDRARGRGGREDRRRARHDRREEHCPLLQITEKKRVNEPTEKTRCLRVSSGHAVGAQGGARTEGGPGDVKPEGPRVTKADVERTRCERSDSGGHEVSGSRGWPNPPVAGNPPTPQNPPIPSVPESRIFRSL